MSAHLKGHMKNGLCYKQFDSSVETNKRDKIFVGAQDLLSFTHMI